MTSTFLLLLWLLWLYNGTSGLPAHIVYTRVQHQEGETLSVQCHYKTRKNQMEDMIWCKIRKNRCDSKFTRVWVQKPHYLLQDDVYAKVVTITMVALRHQDSGRYWCMRNDSQTLFPLLGIQLEVSQAPKMHLSNSLKSGMNLAMDQDPISDLEQPFTTDMTLFTPGFLTLPRPLPSSAPEAVEPTSMADQSFTGAPMTLSGHKRTEGSHLITEAPSSARPSSDGPAFILTKAGPPNTNSFTRGMYPTSRSPPIRPQDFDPTVLAAVVAIFPLPVLMVIFYGLWKRRHVGSEYAPFLAGAQRVREEDPMAWDTTYQLVLVILVLLASGEGQG
ncbi:PREDICTED: trem-like transcript 2 protein [Elephantulus edwardii]|uniref:trem-like transcript 2 protein n=1 Tax=Elephantulus edwardii TaxID=28737 RepID=UPI0003F088AF|nr:PREDICTED: trem-like transcript 2 protein [Elephantulus edwardii]